MDGERSPGVRLTAFLSRFGPPAAYLLAAIALVAFYTQRSLWLGPGMEGWTDGQAPFPFRYRALPIWIVSGGAPLFGREHLSELYFALATLSAGGALVAFRSVLGNFLRTRLATLLSLGLAYTMVWHYGVLNALYFPFDLPAVLFFTAGWAFLLRRQWTGYYAVFLLGCLNRETILFLTVLHGLTDVRRVPLRRLLPHLVAQAALYLAVKTFLLHLYSSSEATLYAHTWWKNRATYLGMLTLRGQGAKDWIKLILAFGGLWWFVPLVWRRTPDALRRALVLVPIFVLALQGVATIDEMRIYAELQPVIAAPVLVALGRWIDDEARA